MSTPSVAKLYQSVIDDVIESMREAVIDEGIDEQVLAELKQLWEQKLKASKALEQKPTHLPLPAEKPKRQVSSGASTSASTSAHPQAQNMPTQVYRPSPVRAQQTQPLDMSGAAATATMALPPYYQQQLLAGTIQLQPSSGGGLTAVIPASVLQQGGNISLQPQQVQMQPQNLSTKVQGQLDGAEDEESGVSSTAEDGAVGGAGIDKSIESVPCVRHKAKLCRRRKTRQIEVVIQLDGGDSSSDDDDDLDDDDDDEAADGDADGGEGEEEPLNSGDDDTDNDDSANLFEMDNVVVCQYDKITRAKNRWRFTLKDGIMNINGRDYVFQKAHGEAEW